MYKEMRFKTGVNMKKRTVLLICFLTLFNLALLSMPYSTLGNINIPDAYVLPHKMVDFSFTNFIVGDGEVPALGDSANYQYDFAGSVRVGLFDRGELCIIYTSTAGVFANVKVRVINETESLPALSLGVTNLFSGVRNYDKVKLSEEYDFTDPIDYISNSPYLVISKSLVIITGVPVMDYLETSFHFGMGQRRFQGKGETVKDFAGVFWGFDVKPSRYWGFDLEWDSQNINFGLNFFYKNFTLRGGMYEMEDFLGIKADQGSKKYAVNISYTLDKFSELKATEKRKSSSVEKQRAMQKVTPANEENYDEDTNPLRDELEQIRQRRKQAEKELEEIRKLLQE